MGVSVTIGLAVCLFACILSIVTTALPFWIHVEYKETSDYWGLWKNCTTYNKTMHCRYIDHDAPNWFRAVQGLMVSGLVVLFLSVVFGCFFHKDPTKKKIQIIALLVTLLGALLLLAVVIVFGVKNKDMKTHFSAGYYLAIIAAVCAFLATLLMACSRPSHGYASLGP